MGMEAIVKTALLTELATWDVGVAVSWSVETPTPSRIDDSTDDATSTPQASFWFGKSQDSRHIPQVFDPDNDGRGVWDLGHKTAPFLVKFWLNSLSDYLAVLDGFEAERTLNAVTQEFAGEPGITTPCQEIRISAYGLDRSATIYWTGEAEYATPAETGVRNLFELSYQGSIAWPNLVQEPVATPTGQLDIGVNSNSAGEVDLDDVASDIAAIQFEWTAPSAAPSYSEA